MLVKAIQEKVKAFFENKEGSHDWEHIKRVWKLSIYLQKKEGGDKELIELCALLHDVSDHKYNGGDFSLGGDVARQWIIEAGGSEALAHEVAIIVPKISFKGAKVEDEELPIEGRIVRDADRLDAIGAIGVARAFAYGGSKNRPLYSEAIKPVMHENKEDYLNSKSHTINHFYEKLLKIKGRMDTNAAKELAHTRHLFMEKYLEQFFLEWDVNID